MHDGLRSCVDDAQARIAAVAEREGQLVDDSLAIEASSQSPSAYVCFFVFKVVIGYEVEAY